MRYRITGNSLIQSTFTPVPTETNPDPKGNFEVVILVESGENQELWHYWRENHRPDTRWNPGKRISSKATGPGAIVQSNIGTPGNFEVVVPEKGGLVHYWHENSNPIADWVYGGIIAPGSTGPGAIIQNRKNNDLEVVVLYGTELRHFSRKQGKWVPGKIIPAHPTGPASLVQSTYAHGNLEVVVLEGHNLGLYYQDTNDPALPWKFGGVISERATGPAGFVQGRSGNARHKNFEVVVPEGDGLAHYWRDHDNPERPWCPGGWVTSRTGAVSAAALTNSDLEGNLEVLSQEENGSLFHYYRYKEDPHGDKWTWYRGSCLWINEGLYVKTEPPQRSRKICQLTGQWDTEKRKPAYNAKNMQSAFIQGTDLGASFMHEGRTYFLFGDTHWRADPSQVPPHTLPHATLDAIAYTVDLNAEKGLGLFVHRSFPQVICPPVSQDEYEVPLDGFSFSKRMFVFFSTGYSKDNTGHRKVMGRSILTRCVEANPDFVTSRADMPLQFQYLTEFSSQKFINVSVDRASQEMILAYHLPGFRDGLLIWGTGAYRADNVYLAFLPLDHEDRTANLFGSTPFPLWYLGVSFFAGLHNGIPRWSPNEEDAVPLFYPAALGELSVRWNTLIGRWVMVYCSGPKDPICNVVSMRLSATPWGPWSPRWVMFDWARDGLGKFMHVLGSGDGLGDHVFTPQEHDCGGAYAPYQIPNYARRSADGRYVYLYYVLSTWNPYQVMLMEHKVSTLALSLLPVAFESVKWEEPNRIASDLAALVKGLK